MVKLSSIFYALRGRELTPFYSVDTCESSDGKTVLGELDYILGITDPEQYVSLMYEFEKYFAGYVGTSFAKGLNSGTSALYFGLCALGVGPGDEVITVGNTFVSTITSIVEIGAIPTFVDIDPTTGMLDVSKLTNVITNRTKAIVPVHMYGNMANMAALLDVTEQHGLRVLEDACQAIGAALDGKSAGSWGDIGCFSFQANKLVGGPCDGGMLVTHHREIDKVVRKFAEPGWRDVFNDAQGRVPSRLPPVAIPILRAKLGHLRATIETHSRQYRRYQAGVENVENVALLKPTDGVSPSHRNVILICENTQHMINRLRLRNIPVRQIYPPLIRIVEDIERRGIAIPETKRIVKHHIALPVGNHITDDMIDETISVIQNSGP